MTATVQTTEDTMAEFDREMLLLRATLGPEDLTEWDMDIAVMRAELEEEIRADDGAEPAAFSTPPVVFCSGDLPAPCSAGGDLVERRGLIFRSGNYPDRAFSLTPDELRAMARRFKKVPIRIEHRPSVLDGKLGHLTSVEASADGRELHGITHLPRWLDEALGAGKRKVSAAFDRLTKTILELSMVENPRIMGAELMAAFSAHLGPPDLSHRAQRSLQNTSAGRAALARRASAEFSMAVADAPAAPPTVNTVVQVTPAPPTEAEDRDLLSRLATTLGPMAASELRRAIAEKERQASSAPHGYNSFNWPAAVRQHVEQAEQLRSMLAALESADGPSAYRPPSAGEVAEAQGRAIARLALARKTTLAELVQALESRLAFLKPKADEAAAKVDGLVRSFLLHPVDGIEALRERYHAAAREATAWTSEVEAAERTRAGLGPALAAAVASAVEGAGGAEQVSRDLADARLIAAADPAPDPDAEELAAVEAQLAALGPAGGRAAAGLNARRDELSAAREARRAEAREVALREASALVTKALGGRVGDWRRLADAVREHPSAFADGLGKALESAPMEALESAGFAGLAGLLL